MRAGAVYPPLNTAYIEAEVGYFLVDAEPANLIDTTGCDTLIKLQSELAGKGIALAFARVRDPVRDMMQRAGVEAAVGAEHSYDRITDGVKAFGT